MDTNAARQQMVDHQIRTWDVSEESLLNLLSELPRHRFVPDGYQQLAYADTQIPLRHGERMMSPSVEGRLLQALALAPQDKVLEIGTGSGYLSACIARQCAELVSIDLYDDFLSDAAEILAELGFSNVTLQQRDAIRDGLPEGLFDAIAITGSMPKLDEGLLASLKPGGRMFVICGETPIMDALLVTRGTGADWTQTSLFETCLPALRHVGEPSAFIF